MARRRLCPSTGRRCSERRCTNRFCFAAAFKCLDCGINTSDANEYYMVHDDVWHAAGMCDGMLCIGCLEARLDRELSAGDFTDCLLNCDYQTDKSAQLM